MKIVIISDTHQRHPGVTLPDGDVLVHCGDFCVWGDLEEIGDFARWFEQQPFKHKLLVAGNHDKYFETKPDVARHMLAEVAPSVTYLQDTEVVIDGLKFFGSPWTPEFSGKWMFHKKRNSEEMAYVWDRVPVDVDVLITHGPAFGTLDAVASFSGEQVIRAGCERLAERIKQLPNLKLHAFGHIHDSYGAVQRENYIAVNAALTTHGYKLVNEPWVIDLEEATTTTQNDRQNEE